MFKNQVLLKKFFSLLVKKSLQLNKTVKFAIKGQGFFQLYHKWIKTVVWTYLNYKYKNKKIKFVFNVYNDEEIDLLQNKIASLPNFIQFLDSLIMCKVLNEAEKQNIPIKTIHDCFYSNKWNVLKLKHLYNNAYCEVLLTSNILETLLTCNNLNDDKELQVLLKKLNWNKKLASELEAEVKKTNFSITF